MVVVCFAHRERSWKWQPSQLGMRQLWHNGVALDTKPDGPIATERWELTSWRAATRQH